MLVQHAALFGARLPMMTAMPTCTVTRFRPIQAVQALADAVGAG
jgi:hypothetical protein